MITISHGYDLIVQKLLETIISSLSLDWAGASSFAACSSSLCCPGPTSPPRSACCPWNLVLPSPSQERSHFRHLSSLNPQYSCRTRRFEDYGNSFIVPTWPFWL